ncbi:MAG: N-acetyltransferase [Candidatus Omnitrophica bacterium]|nr:N-acetyltransferase [Candidatus Omnitrophota bacterium]MBU4473515.1 N-acetyltransferase [Candidatus Omnitrophota bacterium]
MIRKARIEDIKQIQNLINFFAKQDLMLPRSLNELYENIRDFWVCQENKRIVGCCALHICWDDLAEIKSLAVVKQRQRKGLGAELVIASLSEAKQLGAKKVFVLTYGPEIFKRFGFKRVRHSQLPHKIWAECINCPKFPNCQEIAMFRQLK